VLKSVPAKKFLSVREVCPALDDGRRLAQEMTRILPAKVGKRAMGHFTAVVYSDWYTLENIDIEFGYQLEIDLDDDLTIPLSGGNQMVVSELPAEEYMLTVTRVGVPELGHGSYSALGVWAEANGYELVGNVREVFLNFVPPDRIEETVTEIQYPARPIQKQLPQLQ